MKRFCVAMVMLMTIAAVGCGNNKVADSGAGSSTVSEPEFDFMFLFPKCTK